MGQIITLDDPRASFEAETHNYDSMPETYLKPGTNILMLQGTYPFQLPPIPSDEKEIYFHDKKKEDQCWVRPGPPKNWQNFSPAKKDRWIEEEVDRCFITGAWVFIKGEPVWMPPAYWFTLNWFWIGDMFMKFRKAQLLEEYFECFAENDPKCIGTFRFKKRRDGLTTRRMARTIWKAIQTRNGWFGIQSKTGQDAKKVCWKHLMTGFNRLPKFFKPQRGGNTDPKTMLEFKKLSERITKSNYKQIFSEDDIFNENLEDDDLNTTIDWRDTTDNAYDGQKLTEITLDEFCKWLKASALNAFYTYKQCCLLDGERVGMIHMITSPPETDGPGLDDGKEMWDASDYNVVINQPGFHTLRWFTSALDSYAGAIDKYGDCDRDKAEQEIMAERNGTVAKKRKAVVRQTPMYLDEIFETLDSTIFITEKEIQQRLKYLRGIKFKDPDKKEAKYIYGNFDWKDGIPYGEVIWKPSQHQTDFSFTGRWCISRMPTPGGDGNTWIEKRVKKDIVKMPTYLSEYVIGVDPYDFKKVVDEERASEASAVIGKCFDFYNTGINDEFCGLYQFRPPDPEIFYMDMIKAAVFYNAWVNSESRNVKIFDSFENHGYYEYMLPRDIKKKNNELKGSATTANMIQEICTSIEGFTATCLGGVWHEDICQSWLAFDPGNTQRHHISMASGHCLLGFAKRRKLFKMKRPPMHESAAKEQNTAILENFF